MGEVFDLVRGAVAASLQSPELARILEENAVQQRKTEGATGLGAKCADGGGVQALFPKLPGERTRCLKLPLWDAARSPMLTRRRSRGSRDARSLRSEEHTSELQSPCNLVCRLLLEKKKKKEKD